MFNYGLIILIISYDVLFDWCNVMVVVWLMLVEFVLLWVVIVVDKSIWMWEIIECNGIFGIVVFGVVVVSWIYVVGSVSGCDEDKFNVWGILVVIGLELGLLLIEEKCLVWMECWLLLVMVV